MEQDTQQDGDTNSALFFDRFNTRIGPVVVLGTPRGLTHLYIDNGTRPIELAPGAKQDAERFSDVKQQLNEYLCGVRREFELNLAMEGTEFQNRVWQALTAIPYGTTASYKDIAIEIGNAKGSRAVGMANNKNPIPIIVPCHRVVGANRKLTGYAYGLIVKQQLLQLELINAVFDRLKAHFGTFAWWEAESPYEVMVGAVLTQNTSWRNVDLALKNIGEHLSPEQIEQIPESDLALLIRSSGFHNQKAIRLKALTDWFKRYDYDIEKLRGEGKDRLREELLAISGIGSETADSILVYAIGKPSFVIDAYTRRIFSRIGLDVPEKYDDFRQMMEQALPVDNEVYAYYHGLMVEHGKDFCNKTPLCDKCPVADVCLYARKAGQLNE